MSTFDITEVIPSKAKAWVGLIGSLLTFAGPLILETTDALPAPWPALVGGLFAVLTALGIYKAPYKPEGAVLVTETTAIKISDGKTEETPNPYQNPWK